MKKSSKKIALTDQTNNDETPRKRGRPPMTTTSTTKTKTTAKQSKSGQPLRGRSTAQIKSTPIKPVKKRGRPPKNPNPSANPPKKCGGGGGRRCSTTTKKTAAIGDGEKAVIPPKKRGRPPKQIVVMEKSTTTVREESIKKEYFRPDIRRWINMGIMLPAVNGLSYTDVRGVTHRASLLPGGQVQANDDDGIVFRSMRTWMASFVELGLSQHKSWEYETKRVRYTVFKDTAPISLWDLYRLDHELNTKKQ